MTAPRFEAAPVTRGITINVTDRVYAQLVEMARKAGRTTNVQAQLLFEAAYSARCKPTGDRELDEAVQAMDAPRPVLTGREAAHAAIVARAALEGSLPPKLHALGGGMAEDKPEQVPPASETPAPDTAPALVGTTPTLVIVDEPLPMATEGFERAVNPAPEPPAALTIPLGPEETSDDEPDPEPAAPAGDPAPPAPADEPAEPAAAEALAEEPPAAAPAGGGGAPVPDPAAPEIAPPQADAHRGPKAAPVEPLAAAQPGVSQATIRYMRSLRACGNSAGEIADIVGLPVETVNEVLG
jgi:hypothetical protein